MMTEGKLQRTADDAAPKRSIPYKLSLTSLVVDAATKTVSSLKDMLTKQGLAGVHGYKDCPPGVPGGKLAPDGKGYLWLTEVPENAVVVQEALQAVGHMTWAWCFAVKGQEVGFQGALASFL